MLHLENSEGSPHSSHCGVWSWNSDQASVVKSFICSDVGWVPTEYLSPVHDAVGLRPNSAQVHKIIKDKQVAGRKGDLFSN